MIPLRYWLAAIVVVLCAAILLAGRAGRVTPARSAASSSTAKPAAGRGGVLAPPGRRPDMNLRVSGSWVLSALPECLLQKTEGRGSRAFVRADLPGAAVPIRPPATLRYRDCTITIRADDALISRGGDRFYIPPVARFYRLGTGLVLFHYDADGAQLRTYVPSNL